MKIKSLISSGTLTFNDLGSQIKGVSPVSRSIRLGPGDSLYLLETSEVLLSAQFGDIKRYKEDGLISVNDRFTAIVATGTVTINHDFGIIPKVVVILDPTGTPTEAVNGTDVTITHNIAYTSTTITNITAGAINMDVRIG
jgi:hypothetical protein